LAALVSAPAAGHAAGVSASALERVLRNDRATISVVLGALTLLSWAQMVASAEGPVGADRLLACCGARFGVAFSMWVVMMAGMMIPSVAPMVLAHAAIVRRAPGGRPLLWSGLFVGGYLLAWTGFSALAALAQGMLFRSGALDGPSMAVGPWVGGAVLLAAGVFQLSRSKGACLSRCRAPIGYFLTEWREGRAGALAMGLRHGVFCVGCCWLLMAVLFVVGIMNILWGAALTAFVIAEKVLPWRRAVVWAGAAACLIGAALLFRRAILAI
jgi:predicted metal-binding membrane protein